MSDSVSTPPPSRAVPLGWLARLSGARLIAVAAFGAALIAAYFFFPRYWLWRALGVPLGDLIAIQPELHRAFFTLKQLDNPWQPIDSVVNRVIEWRLLFPLIGHYLGFSPGFYFALPHVGCLLALAAIAQVSWRATQEAVATVAITMLAATTSWFFVSTGWLGYFDSWLMLALVLACFGRSRWVLLASALLAPWIDERFILALPLCAAIRSLPADNVARDSRAWRRDVGVLLLGIAPYVLIRLGAELSHSRATSADYWAQRPLVPAPFGGMTLGLWHGLRLGWIFAVISLVTLWRGKRWLALAAIVVSFAVNVCVADDLSRSTSIALPVVLAGVLALWRTRPHRARVLIPVAAVGNLILPAAHVIASPQSANEAYHTTLILGLPAELARSAEPPHFASPFVYDQLGMDAFTAGNRERAKVNFDLALAFDPHFAKARADRGIVLFIDGHPNEGMAELTAALTEAPWLYEARMQRATFRQQQGDVGGALEDVNTALTYMPPDWPRRKDAEAFARALASKAAR